VRIVVTTFLVLFLGALAGGMVAQILAVSTGADQEFIAVFFLVPLVVLVSTVVFLIVQFFSNPRRAATVAVIVLVGIIVAVFAGLLVLDHMALLDSRAANSSRPVIFGLTLPNAVAVIVQWLIVLRRNRAAPPAMLFGRGPGAPA
jgi:hypothetical protein